MSVSRHPRVTGLISVTALALVLAACGADDDGETAGSSSTSDDGAGLTTITVGTLALIDLAPVFLGDELGIFEEHGLDLEMSMASSGAAILPGVVSGDYDFGFSASQSVILAASSGIDLRVVASGVWSTGDRDTEAFGVTSLNPEVQTIEDLEGLRVATNALNSVGDTVTWKAAQQAGIDPDSIEFVEMPFPSMLAALENGDVDAAWNAEPFITIALDGGAHVVAEPMIDLADEWEVSAYFTSSDFAENNPDAVERFQAAINEAMAYAQDNPDEVRDILPSYLELSPELIETVRLPAWNPGTHLPTWEFYYSITEERGNLANPVDLVELLSFADTE